MVPSSHGSISADWTLQSLGRTVMLIIEKKSTRKWNCAIPACVVQESAVFPGTRAGSQHVRMEWNFGKGWTSWLRSQSMIGEKEMALMNVIIILKRAGCWSSRGAFRKVERMQRRVRKEKDEESTGSWQVVLTAAPHIRKMTLRKNGSIYLPFPSIYLPNSIHQYLSFPRGFRHV